MKENVVGYMILFQVYCISNNLLVWEHKKAEGTISWVLYKQEQLYCSSKRVQPATMSKAKLSFYCGNKTWPKLKPNLFSRRHFLMLYWSQLTNQYHSENSMINIAFPFTTSLVTTLNQSMNIDGYSWWNNS